MKKYLFFLVFWLPIFAFGQNWCPDGATWYYGFDNGWIKGYYKIGYVGDTIINAIQSKKLNIILCSKNIYIPYSDSTISFIGTEYTYADTDRVYIFKHNHFYTLYDFSTQVGNTWTVPEIKHYNGCDTIGTIRVDSIGTTNINGQILRYIWVSPVDSSQKWGWSAKIIEGIGPVMSFYSYPYPYNFPPYSYLFPQKFDLCGLMIDENIEGGNFRCYSDNTPFSYTSDVAPSCDFIASIKSIEKNPNQIKVFPNPSNGFFTIDIIQEMSIKEIRLTDLLGNIILQQQSDNETSIKIDNCRSGIYILTAIDKDQRMINRIIISCL